MSTQINRIIIHELKKEATSSSAEVVLFDSLINSLEPRIINLVGALNKKYRESNETYGIFNSQEPTVFHDQFSQYFTANTDAQFIAFSQEATRDLRRIVSSIAPAKGGFLLFVHYRTTQPFVGVFLVRNTEGISFTMNNDEFNIDDVEHIDFENLAMACRINLDLFSAAERRYLSFINTKSDFLSKYFTLWISSTDLETFKQDTNNLHALIRAVEIPANPDTGEIVDRTTLLNSIHTHIQNSPGKRVVLREISQRFFFSDDYLLDQCEEKNIRISGEFKADTQALKKFVHIKVKGDLIDLAFPLTDYNGRVRIDENNQDRIIITSQRLADEIRERMIDFDE